MVEGMCKDGATSENSIRDSAANRWCSDGGSGGGSGLVAALKCFFAVPSPYDIASRHLDQNFDGQRRATWAVTVTEPDVSNGDLVGKYGHTFVWSPLHQTHKQLEPLRSIGDPDCDAVLQVLDPQPDDDILHILLKKVDAANVDSSADDDRVLLGERVCAFVRTCSMTFSHLSMLTCTHIYLDFVARYSTVPEWVDWDEITRGQQVFIRDMPICGLTLFYLSLVGGFSAPLITKVLRATGYLTR